MHDKEVKPRLRTTNLVNLVAHDDLDDGFGNIGFKLTVPPRECLKGLPVGNIVHWITVKAHELVHDIRVGRRNVPSITPCAPR